MTMSVLVAKVLNKLGFLKWVNINARINTNNSKIKIPIIKELGYDNLSLTEPWMTQVLLKLKPVFNGQFVDVGVNIGQTLIKAYSVFGSLHYTGFEPNYACVSYVEELVRVNNFRNCNIIPVGIDCQSRVLKLNFFANGDTDSSATIIEQFRPDQHIDHTKFVPVFDHNSLSNFLPDGEFPILKIDVEGAELEVIKGILPWIEATKPIILMEVLPAYNSENAFRINRQTELETILRSLNYKLARIKKENSIRLVQLDEIGIHSKIEDCDYLIYPSSLSESIQRCFR